MAYNNISHLHIYQSINPYQSMNQSINPYQSINESINPYQSINQSINPCISICIQLYHYVATVFASRK